MVKQVHFGMVLCEKALGKKKARDFMCYTECTCRFVDCLI